ncbi:Carboxylic ester hydrolase [Fusarium keratoplasticum]|uniref:Carboxylic ester hydrolase n=1 Tax=Fusarium keratoplasticum TaxID=1328300 RepID=A0ACC0QU12_9HYPO|nr:Carboxylic ester hydrolase [Fusarium keratoplasticum]KAI8665975.1 Carboxylic ester hydrolase [Fusarium keratoplasticum]
MKFLHVAWFSLITCGVIAEQSAQVTMTLAPASTIIGTSRANIDGVELFNGIPYAQPPLGQLRLKPPQRSNGPFGTLDATKIAPTCPQFRGAPPAFSDAFTQLISSSINTTFFQTSLPSSEDCLTLNIVRPAGTNSDAKLPVLLWIHGGGFQVSVSFSTPIHPVTDRQIQVGSATQYDGSFVVNSSVTAHKPVIYVAINYRLAGYGFLGGKDILADGSANIGLRDQRMALEWVADNIASFGGDPNKVNIWGESAGSLSVFNQLGLYGGNHTYNGKPLFRGAIMNSGSLFRADPIDCPKAQTVYDTVVKNAGCSSANDTLACLRNVDYGTFEQATNSVPGFISYNSIALSYLPRPDGEVLNDSAEVIVQSGNYAAVPLIIGGQEDEGTLFSFAQSNLSDTSAIVEYLSSLYFHGATKHQLKALVETYNESIPAGSPYGAGFTGEVYPGFKRLSSLLGDIGFTLARRSMLYHASKANPTVPIWSYEASYDRDTPVLGTFHGSDLLPVFFSGPQSFASQSLFHYYFNFAYSLDPNDSSNKRDQYPHWPKWSDKKQLLHLFRDNSSLLTDDFRWESYTWMMANEKLLRF